MNEGRTSHRALMLAFLLGLVLLAALPAQAASRPAASYYTPQALKALGQRAQAQADSATAASYYTPQALKALGGRGAAQAAFYAVHRAQAIQASSPGFQWGDAGIGAAFAAGILLLLAGARMLRMRRSSRLATS